MLDLSPSEQEEVNAALVALKDAWWAIDRDRLGLARSVAALIPGGSPPTLDGLSTLDGWWAIQVSVGISSTASSRSEAGTQRGIHVLITGHGLDFSDLGGAAPDR